VQAEFPSVVDAVRYAAKMQRGILDREPMVPDERRIRFRIGINLGLDARTFLERARAGAFEP